eukprot:1592515-Rhodomonas_salina.1
MYHDVHLTRRIDVGAGMASTVVRSHRQQNLQGRQPSAAEGGETRSIHTLNARAGQGRRRRH